jgi:Xaa-Pro aminopeptidase
MAKIIATQRIRKALNLIKHGKLDALLVSSQANISYLTSYISRDSYFLVSSKGNVFFTDSRYTQEALRNLRGIASIKEIKPSGLFDCIKSTCKGLAIRRLGFEASRLNYIDYLSLKDTLSGITITPTASMIERMRLIKDSQEIVYIKKATRISIQTLQYLKRIIRPGKKELEIAAEIERFIRYHGAEHNAFETIVASGANTSFPHHITSDKRLQNHEAVLVDMGTSYLGYKSDLTRVFFLGKMRTLVKDLYTVVLEAQKEALRVIKPGLPAKELDDISRRFIAQKGYGEYFTHSLGHGVGLEVHEGPSISSQSKQVLETGMVFTIEPAIYLPKKCGIRIEDMVLVTKKGCEVISGSLNK